MEDPQRQQIDLTDLFADIGELQYEIRYLRKSLQVANERIIQLSKPMEEEKKKKEKPKDND